MNTVASEPRVGALVGRLREIGVQLRDTRSFWQPNAFRSPRLAWEETLPDLSAALRALDPAAIARLQGDPLAHDQFLAPWFPVAHWRELEQVATAVQRPLAPWPRDGNRDVPGRKWSQVVSFAAAVEPVQRLRCVDWCAGKAHLARALAVQWGNPGFVALERDRALVEAGASLAGRAGLDVRTVGCDVMGEGVRRWFEDSAHLVALHACGPLHRRLLDLALVAAAPALSLAPCCYHLGTDGHLPRSGAGRECSPGLQADDLRTAVQESVTAGGHARRRREKLQAWQLGVDALLRDNNPGSQYLPLPSVPAVVLAGDFAGFCAFVAERKGLRLPQELRHAHWEARGHQRFWEVSALDLVRQRFRRLIELWVVLDLAVALEEGGYRVRLETFCERSVSPRNLLLQARLESLSSCSAGPLTPKASAEQHHA